MTKIRICQICGCARIAEKAKTDAMDAMDKALGKKANILRRVGKWPIKILRKVKSSGYKTHKSLDLFCEKYSDRIRDRYLMYTKDLSKDGALQMVPVYMAPFL